MRTWKNVALVIVVAVLGIVGFIACEDKDDDPPDPVLVGSVGGIPVYRADGVSVADGATALATINTCYGFFSGNSDRVQKFTQQVKQILIVSGNTAILKGTVLEVGSNTDEDTLAEYIMFTLTA